LQRRDKKRIEVEIFMQRNGQALAELAIFGAFFLLILSALITYGLRFNFQQKADMTTFRRALALASSTDDGTPLTVRGSGSYSLMEEHVMPDPSDSNLKGVTIPITSSASVTRDPMSHMQAVDAESLAGPVMDIQTQRATGGAPEYLRRRYLSSGFRIEYDVAEIDKYKQVYGSVLARNKNNPNDWVSLSSDDAEKSCPGGEDMYGECIGGEHYAAIRITDSCVGNLADYESCYMQSRMLVDDAFCTHKCEIAKIPGDDINCGTVCGKLTNPPNKNVRTFNQATGGAWYAADYIPCPDAPRDRYGNPIPGYICFPVLESMFNPSPSRTLGLQKDIVVQSTAQDTMNRTETSTAVTTDETMSWLQIANKTMLYQNNLGSDAYEINRGAQPEDYVVHQNEIMPSEMSGSTSESWDTPK
jgi:hypothetical protein